MRSVPATNSSFFATLEPSANALSPTDDPPRVLILTTFGLDESGLLPAWSRTGGAERRALMAVLALIAYGVYLALLVGAAAPVLALADVVEPIASLDKTAVHVIGVALFVALELQGRIVEEPYLLQTHGERYGDYTARVGRFVPGLGRLPDR